MTVEQACELVETIQDVIDGLDPDVVERGQDFFDSVLEKAESIETTILSRGIVSEAQESALENMLEGVRKWER